MALNVLIVGGGIGGMSAAIALRRVGVAVELIDIDPLWRVYGAGITIIGLSLRAFDHLDVLGEIRQRGYVGRGVRQINFDGEVRTETAHNEEGGGILRPVLHDILASTVRKEGASVHLGVTVETLAQADAYGDVTFTDGRTGRYDLVIGADGIYSSIRSKIFPDAAPPKLTGQGCWRVVAPRPANMERGESYLGGPVKLGLNPVSREQMYLFLLEHVPDNPRYSDAELVPHFHALTEAFGGNVPAVRASIHEPSQVNYRPLEWLLLPSPWYRGRVVLIGDAAHATTPHLASGAGLAAEDGLALAEELAKHSSVPAALEAFMARRFNRARLVVESSVRIGDMQMSGQTGLNVAAILGPITQELQAPF
jgi:2-polyprenyl-6-methoxyphenol hydroxylase-like FAD-dependent oxidoreductase